MYSSVVLLSLIMYNDNIDVFFPENTPFSLLYWSPISRLCILHQVPYVRKIVSLFVTHFVSYFPSHNVFKIHFYSSMGQKFQSFWDWVVSFYIYTIFKYLLIHQRAFGLFPFSNYVNNAAISTSIQISHWDPSWSTFRYVPWSGIATLYVNYILNSLKCYSP